MSPIYSDLTNTITLLKSYLGVIWKRKKLFYLICRSFFFKVLESKLLTDLFKVRDEIVTSNRNQWIIHIFNIIIILNTLKIFEDHGIRKFINIINFRKLDFLSAEKISEPSRLVNKYIMQSWFKKLLSIKSVRTSRNRNK